MGRVRDRAGKQRRNCSVELDITVRGHGGLLLTLTTARIGVASRRRPGRRRDLMRMRGRGRNRARRSWRASAATAGASAATPHAVPDHISEICMQCSRTRGGGGEQTVDRGLLCRIYRTMPGVGIMVPISEVNASKELASSSSDGSATRIPSLR